MVSNCIVHHLFVHIIIIIIIIIIVVVVVVVVVVVAVVFAAVVVIIIIIIIINYYYYYYYFPVLINCLYLNPQTSFSHFSPPSQRGRGSKRLCGAWLPARLNQNKYLLLL